jgi:hypothetical protein
LEVSGHSALIDDANQGYSGVVWLIYGQLYGLGHFLFAHRYVKNDAGLYKAAPLSDHKAADIHDHEAGKKLADLLDFLPVVALHVIGDIGAGLTVGEQCPDPFKRIVDPLSE